MKNYKSLIKNTSLALLVLCLAACNDRLNEPPENTVFSEGVDFSNSEDMILPLLGAYAEFYTRGWEGIPLISVRGDDVNAGGLGDQQNFAETDNFNYVKEYWMYNSLWEVFFRDIYTMESAIVQIDNYLEFATGETVALGAQYKAEARVMQAFLLFQMSRVWGDIFIPSSPDPSDVVQQELSTKEEVMQHISDLMDDVMGDLPAIRPNERNDVPGGITRFTAQAVKALANLELQNWQGVADATSAIISSGKFSLMADYYNLFKKPGKLSNEVLLELQYSDYGTPEGPANNYLMAFFGPQGWTPKVTGAAGGWGFYEPSIKWIKFMLDRGESIRLETSVLFSPRGIAEIQSDPDYADLPSFISNVTRSGDQINDYARAMFASGKHYLPSEQLTPGRRGYGSSKNFICIRLSEILLMHAEALLNGANSSAMTATVAVNMVRARAQLPSLTSVTIDDVLNEKFAELAMEWGTRYYDMIRLDRYNELSYEGRTFTADDELLPYPQNQVDQIPQLKNR